MLNERSGQRRRLARAIAGLSVLIVVSTVVAWMNHPRVVTEARPPHFRVIIEVGHTIGVATRPAGALVIVIALLALTQVRGLSRGSTAAGRASLGLGVGVLAVVSVEVVQLLLGRRNWISHLTPANVRHSLLGEAVGGGAWLCAGASVALIAAAWTYVWRSSHSWRDEWAIGSMPHEGAPGPGEP